MPRQIQLFISAGPDLEPEREALGKALAQMPVALGWTIKRTPAPGEPVADALHAIRQADAFLLLMGQDITAPVGMEWDTARRAGRSIFPFLKNVARTPAGLVFVHDAQLPWTRFQDATELARQVQLALARHLLAAPVELGLSPQDWEQLNALLPTLQGETEPAKDARRQETGGAGGGGIILPRPPDAPRTGPRR